MIKNRFFLSKFKEIRYHNFSFRNVVVEVPVPEIAYPYMFAIVCCFCFTFLPGLLIRIHFLRIRIQHFRLNTDPDPGF